MDCKYRAEDLLAYVDNELSPEETQNMANHVRSCHDCKIEVNELRNVTSLLAMLPDIEFSEEVRIRLSSKLKESIESEETTTALSPRKDGWKFWKVLVPAFASLACLLMFYTSAKTQNKVQNSNSQSTVIEMASLATLNMNPNLNVTINGKKLSYNNNKQQITLKEEDTLSIGQGSNAFVSYPGDINIQVAAGAEFTIYDRWFKLTRGKGYFKLAKQHDEFQVTTPDVTVAVIGTTFTVGIEEKGSTVSLIEGTVRFETRKGTQLMTAGQTLKTTEDGSFTLKNTDAHVEKEIIFNIGQRASEN